MLDQAKPFQISPPFGRWFRHSNAYSVFGSFTLLPRPGSRLVQVLRTVRPFWLPEGEAWANRIGLRNAGIDSCGGPTWEPHQTMSIALITGDTNEWAWIARWLEHGGGVYVPRVEFNISCPNTEHSAPTLPSDAVLRAIMTGRTVIFKMQPLDASIDIARRLVDVGARYLHLSNTLPSPVGGVSGAPLREVNLRLVERVALMLGVHGPQTEIIAGGGIYSLEHLRAYRDAGAVRFSLSTAFMWPPRAAKILGRGIRSLADDGPVGTVVPS